MGGLRPIFVGFKRYKMTLIGVIGGSGLYDLEDVQDKNWIEVETEYGKPSDSILTGSIGSQQ